MDNHVNKKAKVMVFWDGGSTQMAIAGDREEDLWKPVGEIAGKLAGDNKAVTVTVVVDDREAAQIIVEEGSVKPGDNKIRLKRSCYGVRKLRKIDPKTGAHQFYDLIPNNMGPRTLDVGARYGQTGGTNAGADMVEGAFVLKSPMPSWMYWPKYYQLLGNGYRDYTDDIYDEDEEIRKLEALFGPDEAPVSDEDDLVLRINEFLETQSKNCLAQLNIDFVSSKLPFNHKQVNSAWREWKKFRDCVRAKEANEVIVRLLAITNASFKDGKKKKTVSSFLVQESDPETERKEIEKAVDQWESIICSMEAVLPVKMEKGNEKKKTSPFGNIEMRLATKDETEHWLEKFHAPDDLAYRVVNVDAPDFVERTENYASEKGITEFDYFLHGSPTSNWKSLIMKGPLLYSDAPIHGKAYDIGVYTARHLEKSKGYTSIEDSKWESGDQAVGVIGIYKAAYGKPLYPDGKSGRYRKLVLEGGYGCLDAKAEYSGYRLNEVVFYEEAALALVGLIFIAKDEESLEAIGKDLYINYDCTITYRDGKHRNLSLASVKVTKEEYRAVVAGAAEGKSLEETEGIVDVLSRMKENAAYIDKWTNLNGSYRKTPLKTPRVIEKMEVSLPDEEVRKIRRMPDPLASFDRPEEHMTIYRNDGSSVTIDYEFGTVRISDTRRKGSFVTLDAEQFLSYFVHW